MTDGIKAGKYIVNDDGIARVSDAGESCYTSSMVMPKYAFIEAYNKYILNAESDKEGEAGNE